MTFLPFDAVFPDFADLSTNQPYDDPEGAADAFDRLRENYLEQIDARRSSLDTLSEATAETQKLLDEIDAAIAEAIRGIMPPESATANADYAIEDSDRTAVSVASQIEQLHDDSETSSRGFRIANATLEQSFQALLDHLTSRRVAEEMDAPTYLERLRGAFRRAADGARAQGDRFELYVGQAHHLTTRLSVVDKIFDFLRDEALPRLSETTQDEKADTSAFEGRLSSVAGFHRSATEFAAHYEKFTGLSLSSMQRAHQEFASDTNKAGAEAEAKQVSRQIERLAFYRPLPFLWALLISALVKVVLAHNSSEVLHIAAIPLLVSTFVIVWGLSIYIGVWARRRRMNDLRDHIHAQLRNVLMIHDGDADLIEFPTVTSDFAPPAKIPVKAYSKWDRKIRDNAVARRNLLAFFIPLALAVVVWIARNEDGYDFVARFPESDACLLASGRMVFATQDAYFVMPDDRVNGLPRLALSQIFPELLADPIERDLVIRVRSRAAEDRLELADCTASNPDKDSLRIIHEGNALGAFGSQETVVTFTDKMTALITALNAPRPINLDLTEAGDDGRVSLTVNLGDTSLDVLAQAISAGGGYGFAPPIRDPFILDARAQIELLLSRTELGDVDLDAITTLLNQVRLHMGGDTTFAEVVNVVFGAPQMSTRLEMGDDFQAIFNGGDGEGGLLLALQKLHLALENSNELAAKFEASLALEGGDTTVFTVLSDSVSAIIERQDNLIAAVSAAVENYSGDAIVVTPTILPPGGGDGNTGPAPAGGDGVVFQTMVVVNPETGAEPVPLTNTLVLPFWPNPVTSETGLTNPQTVFDWGSNPENLRDPSIDDEGGTYFGRVAKTLVSCLADNGQVEMDVLGLASRSWDNTTDASTAAELNYYLAEGRRVGMLRQLSLLMQNSAFEDRILVELADGTTMTMSEIIARSQQAGAIKDTLPGFARFGDIGAFENRRATLLSVTGLSDETASPLEELFARSVILKVIRSEGGPCTF